MPLQQACVVAAAGLAGGLIARCAVSKCRRHKRQPTAPPGEEDTTGEPCTLRTAAAQTSSSLLPQPHSASAGQNGHHNHQHDVADGDGLKVDAVDVEAELGRLRRYIEEGASPRASDDATCMRNCIRKLAGALRGQIPHDTTTTPPCKSTAPGGAQMAAFLHSAVARDMLHAVSLMLEHGVSADVSIRGKHPLHVACERKNTHPEMIVLLLRHGADPNAEDAGNSHVTALHLAVTHGSMQHVQYLLDDSRTDRDKANSYGWRASHLAAAMNRVDVLGLLDEGNGVDVSMQNNRGCTPLHLACTSQAHAASKWLITQKGASVCLADGEGNTPLHLALLSTVKQPALHEIVDLMLQRGARVTAANARGRTPLHSSLRRGHGKLSAVLLVAGADPGAPDDSQVTPLHLAASCGDVGMLALLLGYRRDGHSLDLPDAKGRMALHVAAANGHLACIELLAKHGACVNAADEAQMTPLLSALHNDRRAAAAGLARLGANGHVVDKDGNTPLALALYQGKEHASLAEELIVKQKVAVNTCDAEGRTPLHWAAAMGDTNLCTLLLDVGADVAARTDKGVTPLHWAAGEGEIDATEIMLIEGRERGIEGWVDVRDGAGRTPLHWALQVCRLARCDALNPA